MKKSLLAAAAAAGVLCSLTACASDYDYAYGPPAVYADVDFMGYYDDFYGPFHGGYWGPQGYFYYSDGARFHRDAGRHFRSMNAPGFHPIQGHAPPPAGRGHAGARNPHP
jgi:hypothetical protein